MSNEDMLEGLTSAQKFQHLLVDVDLSALAPAMRKKVKTLLELGHRMSIEQQAQTPTSIEELQIMMQGMESFPDFYKKLSEEMAANQRRLEETSQTLLDYATGRRDQLIDQTGKIVEIRQKATNGGHD